MSRFISAVVLVLLCCAGVHAAPQEPVRVYAAASLTNALTDIGKSWKAEGHETPTLVFAASSTLAKQIMSGAPADIFASADISWMEQVGKAGQLARGTRVDLLGNTLVLIAPKARPIEVRMERGFDLAKSFTGKLCTGEPGVVPVGIYAKAALQSLGWWDALQGRIVGTDDVRTALAFVERGECPLGIVYATDAAISDKVQVLARFPEDTHEPIVYPFALTKSAGAAGRAFFDYLKTEPARRAFQQYGFTLLAP